MIAKNIINLPYQVNLKIFFVVALFMQMAFVSAQFTVTGTVKDAKDNSEMSFVTVYLKGTSVGTTTDINGMYQLQADFNDTLVFSFVGFLQKEIMISSSPVDGRIILDVLLEEETFALDELVIVGYSKIKKEDVTGVVSKIDTKTFNKGVLSSPDRLIAGKIAGVNVTSAGGEPGAQVNIRIRGGTSLSASNQPLFVVDGVPIDNSSHNPSGMAGGRNPLNFINPSDIQDVTVLKDASAAAIYGSRGANGVIIITTKTGKSGKPQFSYDGSYGITTFTNPGYFLNIEEFIYTIGKWGPKWNDILGDSDTDWVNAVTQLAQNHNHNLSMSVGGESNSLRISLNYQDLNGVLNTSSSQRMAGSINASQKLLNDNLVITLNTKHSFNMDRYAPNVMNTAFTFDPSQSITSEDPKTGYYYEFESSLAQGNPVSSIEQTFDIGRSIRNLVGVKAVYSLPFIPGLKAKVNYSYDRTDGIRQLYQPTTLKAVSYLEGEFVYEDYEAESQLVETYLDYTKELESLDLRMELTGGYSYQEFYRGYPRYEKIDSLSVDSYNISDPEKIVSNIDELVPMLREPLYDQFENRLISFWGRVNFSLINRYLFTATIRHDGSTRFGEDNRWGWFPSLAVGWKIIVEDFAQNLNPFFKDVKLRVSWGITGSQEIGDYLYLKFFEPGDEFTQVRFGDDRIRVIRPTAVDPDIKWEETSSFNIGLDYELMEGRFSGSFDFYNKDTKDLLFLINFPMGTITGVAAVTNIGQMNNKGFEAMFNAAIISEAAFAWNINFNASYNRNEIVKLDNIESDDFIGYQVGSYYGEGYGSTIQILREGKAAYSFFVREHLMDENGVPRNDGTDYNGDGSIDDLDIYVDQNNDDVINEKDLVVKGNPWPKWTLGITSSMNYRNIDFSFTLRSKLGFTVHNNVSSSNGYYAKANGSFAPANIHRSAYEHDFREHQSLSDIYLENGSFVKLDNITLGYNFELKGRIQPRLYFTASNVLTLSGYSGVDPEIGPSAGAADENAFGIDINHYPRGRRFMIGLNLNF